MPEDLDRLQGAWRIVSIETDGNTMGGGGSQIEIRGQRFTTSAMGAVYEGTVTIDQAARPKHFDLHFDAGPERGNTSLGIYQLDGDSWKICLTTRGSERPKLFAAPPETGIVLETLVRSGAAEPERQAAGEASPQGAFAGELAGEWTAVSLVRDGDALPPSMLSYGKRRATDREVTVKFGPQVILKAAYSVDRTQWPMTMDYVLEDGRKQQGIWRLEDDRLTTCFSAPGQSRPADFATSKGDGKTLAVWTPAKK